MTKLQFLTPARWRLELCSICGSTTSDICTHSKEEVGEYIKGTKTEKACVIPVREMTYDEAVKEFPNPSV